MVDGGRGIRGNIPSGRASVGSGGSKQGSLKRAWGGGTTVLQEKRTREKRFCSLQQRHFLRPKKYVAKRALARAQPNMASAHAFSRRASSRGASRPAGHMLVVQARATVRRSPSDAAMAIASQLSVDQSWSAADVALVDRWKLRRRSGTLLFDTVINRLNLFATRETLLGYATKVSLSQYATVEALNEVVARLDECATNITLLTCVRFDIYVYRK